MAKSSHHNLRVAGILAAFLVIQEPFCQPVSAGGSKPRTDLPSQTETITPSIQFPIKLPKLPPTTDLTNHLDSIHDSIFLRLQRPVQRVDDFFVRDLANRQPPPISRFRLGLYMVMKDEEAFSARFEPEVEAEVRLPNLEERWGIFVDSMRNNDLPGTDPTERKSSLNTGLRRAYDDWKLHADVGVRWRSGPAGMGRIEWRPDFQIGRTKFYPRERIFYESWNGFGEMTSLTANYAIKRCFARFVSGATWTENSNGLEWELTTIIGHVAKLIETDKQRDLINDEHVAQGLSIRYSMFGHNSKEEHRIDRQRITFVYRYPVYRDWIFLQVAPGIEWRNESNWENIPSIQIGFDTLFWEVTHK